MAGCTSVLKGIVHGTFNTLLNAGRLKLGVPDDGDLTGKLFISSGLGGMSGAQGKQLKSQKAVANVAEVDRFPDRNPSLQG